MSDMAEQRADLERSYIDRRKYPRKKSFLPARLAMAEGSFECRVLDFSRGGAKVEFAPAVADKQAVTLIVEQVGTYSGVVAWRGVGCFGMQFLAQPATADATRAAISAAAAEPAARPALAQAELVATPPSEASLRREAADAQPVARELAASEPVGQPAPVAPAGDAAPALRDGNSALSETDATAPVPAPKNSAARRREADVLKLLRDEKKVFTLPAGELLFREGDPAGRMYIVRSGSLRIQDGGAGDEEVGSGGIVGEMGLVDKHLPRNTSAYALTECELVEIDARRFKALIEQQPGFAVTVMQVLTRRLRHLSEPAAAEPGQG